MIDANGTHFPRKYFWALLIPVALVAIVVAFAFRQMSIDSEFEQVSAAERSHLQQISAFVAAEVSSSVHRLDALTQEAAVQLAIDTSTPRAIRVLQSVFLTLANRNPTCQQIRWIDQSGAERVHVMRSQNAPIIVKPQQLQNESSRDYFKNVISLPGGEIHISRFNFDIENGQSKKHPLPTIRVAKTIQNSRGQGRGILIIDISTPYMLEALRIAHDGTPDTDYIIVSGSGYGLAPNAQAGQAKTNPEQYAVFSTKYPAAWNHISSSRAGSAELEDGIWVWKEILPEALIARIAAASSGDFLTTTRIHSDDLTLTLVAHKSTSALAKSTKNITVQITVGTILLLIIYAWSLLFMMRSQESERRAAIEAAHAKAQASHMQRLKELEERFHLSVEASSVGMLVVDAEGTIILNNTAAESMLGYEKGTLQGLSVDLLLPSAQRSDHSRLRAEFLRNPEVRKMGQGRKLEAVTADGRRILVEVGLNPYLDHGNQVVLASIVDISGNK